jgi:hypothetical protein
MRFRVADSFAVFKRGDREFGVAFAAIGVGFAANRSARSVNEFGFMANAIPKGGCANGFSVNRSAVRV